MRPPQRQFLAWTQLYPMVDAFGSPLRRGQSIQPPAASGEERGAYWSETVADLPLAGTRRVRKFNISTARAKAIAK